MDRLLLSDDISNGKERTKIPVYNDYDDEGVPNFVYLNRCVPEPSATTSRCCPGACDENCPCSSNVYKDQRVQRPSKLANILTECGPGCSCDIDCSNRLSQQGVRYPLEIFKTNGRGWGVRVKSTIPSGAVIAEYTGELSFDEMVEQNEHSYGTLSGENDVIINATNQGNVTRFINHSCNANVFAVRVKQTGDPLEHIVIFCIYKVYEGQELALNYGNPWWQIMESRFNLKCSCGSTTCRYS
ncbi:unnamed protein product, partial [Mesorhabditis belari]|uniref:SET domain-containing protein n=1 Tax=Mesorhabditis belari TaxID=2138241 RepID=A0AAF3FEZ6_9BILA